MSDDASGAKSPKVALSWKQLDEVCERFEAAWEIQLRPDIELSEKLVVLESIAVPQRIQFGM